MKPFSSTWDAASPPTWSLFLQQFPIRMPALLEPPGGPQARRPPADDQDFAPCRPNPNLFGIYYLQFTI